MGYKVAMNFLALALAVVAVVIFLVTWFDSVSAPPRSRRWAHIALGLAFFASSFIVQLVWVSHQWTIGGH